MSELEQAQDEYIKLLEQEVSLLKGDIQLGDGWADRIAQQVSVKIRINSLKITAPRPERDGDGC